MRPRVVRAIVVAVALVGVVAVLPAVAQTGRAPRRLVFVGPEDNPPFASLDSSGRPQGFDVDLVRALGREAGVEIEVRLVTRAEARRLFQAGGADLQSIATSSSGAAEAMLLTPMWQLRQVAMAADPASAPRSFNGLAGERVAVVAPSASHDELSALPDPLRPHLIPTANHGESLRRVQSGDATFAVGNSLALRATREFAENSFFESELRSIPYYLATQKGRADLQPIFVSAYLRLQQTGELGAIIERTLLSAGNRPWWSGWQAYLVGVPVVALLGFIGMGLWSRALRGQVRARTDALASTLELHRATLESTELGIIATDLSGRITSHNPKVVAMLGLPPDVAASEHLQDWVAFGLSRVASPDAARLNFEQARDSVQPQTALITVDDGRVLERQTNAQTVGGEIIGCVWTFRDVTARVRAEREVAVRAREQATLATLGQRALAGIDFQLLADQAIEAVRDTLGADVIGVFELTNRGFLLRGESGWSSAAADEFRGTSHPSVFLSGALGRETVNVVTRDHHEALVSDPLFTTERLEAAATVVIPGRHQPFGVLVVGTRLPKAFSQDDRHFLHGAANVLGAAFERAAVEHELRKAVASQRATLESTAEGIVAVDDEDRVTSYNQRLIDMWRLPPEVEARRLHSEWSAWALQQMHDPGRAITNFRPANQAQQLDTSVIQLKDGRTFERHAQPQVLDGRIVGRVWSFRDVTDRLKAEDEQRRVDAQMQHVQKLESLGVLAGGIAHDFNNLLVGLLGHAGLALMDAPPGSPVFERLKHIETGAMRAAELTNQMLAYSGKGHFVVQQLDLSLLVQEMAALLGSAVAKNATLVMDLAPELPSVRVDPAQLRQVVMNLITNASDAIGAQPGRIELTTSLVTPTRADLDEFGLTPDLDEGEYVCLQVRDSGCGMDEATRGRVFEPFFTTKFTGRGLGLAAVLGIIRGHQGAIKIASAPGQGTTFRVLLPAAGAPAKAALDPSRRVAAARGHILVVDDEPSVRMIARECLRRAGFTVATANDGDEAIQALRQGEQRIDAVLLDLTMARMSGMETFRQLRALQPDIRVVLMSGYSDSGETDRDAAEGLAGFIQKPFLPAALVEVMANALEPRAAV